jgi:hypothetical protein
MASWTREGVPAFFTSAVKHLRPSEHFMRCSVNSSDVIEVDIYYPLLALFWCSKFFYSGNGKNNEATSVSPNAVEKEKSRVHN